MTFDPEAPWGRHPATGQPYSERNKIVAGVLQILLPFGIGRFYTGHNSLGLLQLLVAVITCGLGSIWSFIDGVIILLTDSTDVDGRMLRG